MLQFSSSESTSLEKRIDLKTDIKKTKSDDFNFIYEIENCSKWILENDYKKVCLQFPDYLLPDSSEVVQKIEEIVQRKVYILGDTAYGSCCIDFTAAKHISADAIIHFGPKCFSKAENIIPSLKIYEKFDIDIEILCKNVQEKFVDAQNALLIILDTSYFYKINEIRNKLSNKNIKILLIEDQINISDEILLYIGESDKKLLNLHFLITPKEIFFIDPKTCYDIKKYEPDNKILKRRYFLSEEIKDSSTIGIVISTLAVQNYLTIIERLKTLIKLNNKKYYLIAVGKPNVAKLGNFPEVDVFVIIGCAMNEIYEDRDYYKPIVTPFDVETALNTSLSNNLLFSYDFNQILLKNNEITPNLQSDLPDVSLLSGRVRYFNQKTTEKVDEASNSNTDLEIRNAGVLTVGSDKYGAGFLAGRSWQGLEQDLGKSDVKLATKGRKGIAQGYENEKE